MNTTKPLTPAQLLARKKLATLFAPCIPPFVLALAETYNSIPTISSLCLEKVSDIIIILDPDSPQAQDMLKIRSLSSPPVEEQQTKPQESTNENKTTTTETE